MVWCTHSLSNEGRGGHVFLYLRQEIYFNLAAPQPTENERPQTLAATSMRPETYDYKTENTCCCTAGCIILQYHSILRVGSNVSAVLYNGNTESYFATPRCTMTTRSKTLLYVTLDSEQPVTRARWRLGHVRLNISVLLLIVLVTNSWTFAADVYDCCVCSS